MNNANNIYYDLTISNVINDTAQSPICSYSETRSIPLLKDTTDYQMSIIRFTLNTSNLPVWIPTIQTGSTQTDINLTIYSTTFSYNGFEFQQYIEFIPQDKSAQLPSPPSQNTPYFTQNNSTGYYNVTNYQYLINLINNTFQSAYSQLVLLSQDNNNLICPIMTLDNNTLCASISNPSNISIYFNQSLYELFSSFCCAYYGYDVANGKNYLLTSYVQDYSTTSSWNPILSIVFTTNMLPIISSQVGNPQLYSNGKLLNNNSNATSLNIITDLVADNFMYTPNVIYNPTSVYRQISLQPGQEIRNIDIQVYYYTKFGEYTPVRLAPNSSCTVKILFSKTIDSIINKY